MVTRTNKDNRYKMIYIPTVTTKRRKEVNILYSPSSRNNELVFGDNITIWDNHTFYLKNKYRGKDKYDKAFEHYLWLIEFINNNYKEGVILITPDVDWMPDKLREVIEDRWLEKCSQYPQLYVPGTYKYFDKINIVGHALRPYHDITYVHKKWTHCLGHARELPCELCTYDSIRKIV